MDLTTFQFRTDRTRTHTSSTAVGVLLAFTSVCLFAGCHSQKQTSAGSMASPGKAASVDNSWVEAARSCWPDLARNGYSQESVGAGLLHHLDSAFPAYSALSRKGGDAELSMPITTVLPPDAGQLEHSQTPVLTRGQAVAGTPPQGAIVQSTDGSVPPDALCSIQSGIPQGFSK